jgi:hypothetical protein
LSNFLAKARHLPRGRHGARDRHLNFYETRDILQTPADVQYGTAEAIRDKRAGVLTAAVTTHPERFVRKPHEPPPLPLASWINKPDDTGEATR